MKPAKENTTAKSKMQDSASTKRRGKVEASIEGNLNPCNN